MTNTRRKSLISTWSYKAVNGQKGPLVPMKLGSFGMSTSHWYAVVALWFAPGAEEGHGTAQTARTYSTVWCQSRILPTGYKDNPHIQIPSGVHGRSSVLGISFAAFILTYLLTGKHPALT